jgi:uncharacterized SAM-binding protein YcdF (DUF218 family)
MSFLATKIIAAFLLPPLNLLMLGGIGLVILKSRPRLGRMLIVSSWLLLYALSMPIVAGMLIRSLEGTPPLLPDSVLPEADAIVVLGGGLYLNAPEYGVDTVKGYALERLRYAARLHRLTGKPILVTGGNTEKADRPEAVAMRESLIDDFHVPVQWIEDQSRTTRENALFSAVILQQQRIHRIYLVTHASHMPRAQEAFEQVGFEVIPAPTLFTTKSNEVDLRILVPTPHTLLLSYNAMYEWLGRLWYLLLQ